MAHRPVPRVSVKNPRDFYTLAADDPKMRRRRKTPRATRSQKHGDNKLLRTKFHRRRAKLTPWEPETTLRGVKAELNKRTSAPCSRTGRSPPWGRLHPESPPRLRSRPCPTPGCLTLTPVGRLGACGPKAVSRGDPAGGGPSQRPRGPVRGAQRAQSGPLYEDDRES